MSDKIISLVGQAEKEPVAVCEWCGNDIFDESRIYKVRGDLICRECLERMCEERED